MGTEVLLPQDCLVDIIRISPSAYHRRRSTFLAGNGFVSAKPNNKKTANFYGPMEQTDRKRKPIRESQQHLQRKPVGSIWSPLSPRRSSSAENLLHNQEVKPGRITIMRRGHSLESFEKNVQNVARDKKVVDLNIMNNSSSIDVYAGSGFFVSPSPNSLPLPSFFSNKKSDSDICATRDLRRLLGILE